MTNRIEFVLKMMVCFLLIFPLSGCWSRDELNTLSYVAGVGLDKTQEPGKIQMTTQIVIPGQLKSGESADGGGGSKAYWNLKNTGIIASDILRDSTRESSHKLYFPHNHVLIFGRNLAVEGVQAYIDTFLRDHETRLSVLVLVSENKADEVLDVPPKLEKVPAINIAKLVKTQAVTSESPNVRLIDFISRLMSETTAPIAPLIQVTGEGEERTVEVSGTAVFKHDKLVGQLDNRETRGMLWVIDGVKSGAIDVANPSGDGKVSLEILSAKGKITPEIKEGTVKIKVEIKVEGNLSGQTSPENLTLLPSIAALEKEESAEIESEIMAALEKARDLRSDIFGFGDTIHWKYPAQWKELEEKWDEVFPTLEVSLDINAKIRSSGSISAPAVPPKE